MTREPSVAERTAAARRVVEDATAIVDGEVIRPARNGQPALVRASRVLKGPSQEYFEVGVRTTCDMELDREGERRRLVLVGGPDLFFLPIDTSSGREEDRLLGSDRLKDWPYRQGTVVAESN